MFTEIENKHPIVANHLNNIRRFFRKLTGRGENYPVIIAPYQTYGTDKMVYLHGRVLEDKNIRPDVDDSLLDILRNTYKRFQTSEKPDVMVQATSNHFQFQAKTNDEGYFRIQEQVDFKHIDKSKPNWINIQYSLVNTPHISAKTQILVPNQCVDFGVISDIDDTVIHTGVTSFLKLKLLYNSLLKSAKKRLPLRGASPFYQALTKGISGQNTNPFFYISNSPWNMYDYLRIFLKESEFPKGPVLLRDFALPWQKKFKTGKSHKKREIQNILESYPKMKFILIGDSGEQDAKVYSEIAKEFPEQVICIYLHISKLKRKMQFVHGIIHQSPHVKIELITDAVQAAHHAFQNKFISKESFNSILNNH